MAFEREIVHASVPVAQSPEMVRPELTRLMRTVESLWQASFPAKEGYLILREEVRGESEGVRMKVIRHDFRAQVDISCNWRPALRIGAVPDVKLNSEALSETMEQAGQLGERAVQLSRPLGAALGFILVMMGGSWALGGMVQAMLVIMLVVVVGVFFPVWGWELGAWVGEFLALGTKDRAIGEVCQDRLLQSDFRRWRALSTQLVSRNGGILSADSRTAPFRR